MTTITDDEFDRQLHADPMQKALDDFLKASGASSVVLLAVGENHTIRTMLFENGDLCECQVSLLKTAHNVLRRLAELAAGEPDHTKRIDLQGMSHETERPN